jgi:hypothetical protein
MSRGGAAPKLLSKDEARRVAANVASLPELVQAPGEAGDRVKPHCQ